MVEALSRVVRPGWSLWVTLLLVVAGVVAAGVLAAALDGPSGGLTSGGGLDAESGVNAMEGDGLSGEHAQCGEIVNFRVSVDPDITFERLQEFIVESKDKPKDARFAAGLAMAEFIMGATYWRTERERHVMARDYLLALAELNPVCSGRPRLIHHLFSLAAQHGDMEAFDTAEKLLWETDEGVMPFEITFEMRLEEVDALLVLGEPNVVYARIDALAEHAKTPKESMQQMLQVARGLRLALERPEASEALWAQRGKAVPEDARERAMSELSSNAEYFIGSNFTAIETEGLWHAAFLAGLHGNSEKEIELYQRLISKGLSPYRSQAYAALLARLRSEQRDGEHADVLGRMLTISELREQGIGELLQRLKEPAAEDVATALLQSVNYVIELESSNPFAPLSQLMVSAAQLAVEHEKLVEAEQYLDQAEEITFDRKRLSDIMMTRAQVARLRQDRSNVVYYLKEVLHYYPGHPQEGDIRFQLLYEMATQPYREADLVGGIIGAITRLPTDPRGIRGLLLVAHRLEELELYELAETYYRLAVLVGTLQQTRDTDSRTAEALLGQARMMSAQEKLLDADSLLRVICTNPRWREIWNSAGPLWADLAIRQGQFREGIRRWRQTCGPPGGDLLPYLFEKLVPDIGDWPVSLDSVIPRKPGRVPVSFVKTAVEAALNQMLEREAFEEVERLLAKLSADEEWGSRLPVASYKLRVLERVAESTSTEGIIDWMRSHALAGAPESDPSVLELTNWVDYVEGVTQRVRARK